MKTALITKEMFNFIVQYTEYKNTSNTSGIFKCTVGLIIKVDAIQSGNLAALMRTETVQIMSRMTTSVLTFHAFLKQL